jgi:hypothetical protein
VIFTFKLARRLAQAYAVVSSAIISVACSGDRLFEALIPSRPTVISIVISPDSVSITPGATIALAAEPRDSTGEPLVDRLISWSSDAPLVATVSERGDVLGVAVGVATISATSEGRVARANVAVGGKETGKAGGVGVAEVVVGVGARPRLPAITCHRAGRAPEMAVPRNPGA